MVNNKFNKVNSILRLVFFCFIILYSKEGVVSGSASGAIRTSWFNLQLISKLRISPAGGDYSSIHEQGNEYVKLLEPLKDSIDKIILQAKERFNAPIVSYDESMVLHDHLYSVIIEDEVPHAVLYLHESFIEDARKKLTYETSFGFNEMQDHFNQNFNRKDVFYVQCDGGFISDFEEYTVSVWVNNRIKQSTLNWISKEVQPLLKHAVENSNK